MRTRLRRLVKFIYRFIKKWVFRPAVWLYKTLKYYIFRRYRITVSFNNEYGDADDRTYIAKKIIIQKEKHLKFRDEDGKMVEHRGAGGLNFIVEDYEYESKDS